MGKRWKGLPGEEMAYAEALRQEHGVSRKST